MSVSKTRICADCGRRFVRRVSPSNAPGGSSYCKKCEVARCLAYGRRPSGVHRKCGWCGKSFETNRQTEAQIKSDAKPRTKRRRHRGRHRGRFCSAECSGKQNRADSPYRDKRHCAREDKRRQRERLRAKGLTSNGTPVKNPNCVEGQKHRVVLPKVKVR